MEASSEQCMCYDLCKGKGGKNTKDEIHKRHILIAYRKVGWK